MPRFRTAPHDVLLYCSVIAIVFALSTAYRDYGYDDPYITFRYTQNLLQGRGLVYNVGEAVLSTTAPGYALLLALSGLIRDDLPLWGNVLSAVGLGVGAISLYVWASKGEDQPLVGAVAGLLLITFPLCILSFGSEMGAYIGTTIAGFSAYARDRRGPAMAWLAVATLIRPDGVLAAGLILLYEMVAYRRLPWRMVALYVMVLLPWGLYATWAFGSPIPATLGAKQAQGRMAMSDSYLTGAWKMLVDHLSHWPLYWLYVPLGAIGVWQIFRCKQKRWILLAWSAGSFLAYVVLGVSRYFWYYVPLVPGIVVSVGSGVGWLSAKTSAARWGRRWSVALTAVLVVGLLWPNAQGLAYIRTHPDRRLAIYRQIGRWMDAHLPPEASIGTLEVGIIGYYARRRIVDFAGLIQPAVHTRMDQQTTYQDTATWAIDRYRPDYLALHSDWFPSWRSSVLTSCRPLRTFFAQGYEGSFTVYECDWTGEQR